MINFSGTAHSYAKSKLSLIQVNKKMDELAGRQQSPFSMSSLSFTVGVKISSTDSLSGINAEEVDYRLSDIIIKLRSGKRLSGSDLEYLRKKNPGLYQKALEIEKERDEYEQELKKCKTKEDVRRVNTIKNQSLLCEAKKAEAANDLGAAYDIEMRVNAINDSHQSFVKSWAYKRLPKDYKEIADKLERRESARGARPSEKPQTEEETAEPAGKDNKTPEVTCEHIETDNEEPEITDKAIEFEPELKPTPEPETIPDSAGKKPAKKREKKI